MSQIFDRKKTDNSDFSLIHLHYLEIQLATLEIF